MPQMNPILWTSLFITFIVTFLLVNPLIFFSKKFSSHKKKITPIFKTLNWKW